MSERKPPWDEDAEINVLGSLLLDSDVGPGVFERLTPDDFYAERHRRVFRACGRLFERGEPCADPFVVKAELDRNDELEAVGGWEFLAELATAIPTAANVGYYVGIVREHSQRRRLIQAGTRIVQIAQERDGRPGSQIADEAMQCVYNASGEASAGLVTVRSAMMPTFAQIEEYTKSQGGLTGVGTGLREVDEATGGWQKGDLIVVAARPSMGKTAFTTGLILNAAVEYKTPVAFFSLEMTKEQIVQRMLCYESLVDLNDLRRGKLQGDDYVRLAGAADIINRAPIWIDDSSGLSAMQIRAKSRRLKMEMPNLGLIVVDYLQLMSGEGENRTQEVSAMSRGLKALAKDLGVPVIALSQLSRACEARSDKRPLLSDLRESGSIEQDADIVSFLYRPSVYEPHNAELDGKAELIIRKQRNGPTPTVHLFFRDYCCRFEDGERKLRVA